jgi:outer membrane protein assembly factor BamB
MNCCSRYLAGVGLAILAGVAVYTIVVPPKTTVAVSAEEPKPAANANGDHVMFGGAPDRNMVNMVDRLSHEFPKGEGADESRILGSRVKWRESLGGTSWGGPIVAGGKVFVGTNNENPRNDRDRGKGSDDEKGAPIDKGILMCFDEKTGKFLWQMVHDKLEGGQVNDWPRAGVCSTPVVDGNRVYYASNRCEVVCLDVNGFYDGNDGFQKEKYQEKTDGDVVWSYDMIGELKVLPHNMTACSPLIVGDLLFIVTANGVDENHKNIPFPEAPSFICMSKKSGKIIWKSNAPGLSIMHGQWSNPAYAVIKGKPQVIFPGGDGWLHAFEPETGKPIWRFDANPKDSKYELGGKGTKSDFIGTPVVYKDRVFIGTGQDPEHLEGIGHFWCIDPAGKEGDISPDLVTDAAKFPPPTKPNPNSGAVWHYGGADNRPFAKRDYMFSRTMSTACIIDDVVYISELAGYIQCLDAKTGKKFWQLDLKSNIWGSCYYVDGKVLVANEDGDLYIFKHDKNPQVMDESDEGSKAAVVAEKKAKAEGKDDADVRKATRDARDEAAVAMRDKVKAKYLLQRVEVGESIQGTPAMANGVLYIQTLKSLYAVNAK